MVPRIFCDFNNLVGPATYSLNAVGSRADLERLGTVLVSGISAVFYDYDEFDNGDPAWLLADGVVETHPTHELVAHVDPESFRWEPRVEED